jgi:RNA polymerase sigma-70 factor (ECF subfamily)
MERSPVPGSTPRVPLAERLLWSLPGLTRFVRRRMGPDLAARESASDIVQSTCRELLRSTSGFEYRDEAAFQGWLRSAAENKLRNRARHWRAERRAGARAPGTSDADAPRHEPEARSARPSQDAMLREEVERLARAMEALPDEYRYVLRRSQIEGASHAALAEETGRSPEAVRKQVARALARLASLLEDPRDTAPRIRDR